MVRRLIGYPNLRKARTLLFPRAALSLAIRLASQQLAGWLGVAAVLLAAPVYGEDAPRRVGSLNYISGEVRYILRAEPGDPNGSDTPDTDNWLRADFDQPVCQDMSLRTGASARARVRIGPDAIEMADETRLNLLNLTDQLIEASIHQGRVYLQLGKLDPGESVEIELPRGSLWLLQPGAYDVETGAGDEPTRIVVFEGKARFVGGAADLPIAAGKAVRVTGKYPAVVAAESDWTGVNPALPTQAEPPGGARPDASGTAPPGSTPTVPPAPQPASGASADQATLAASGSASAAPATRQDRPAAASDTTPPAGLPAQENRPDMASNTAVQTAADKGTAAPARHADAVTADSGQKPADDFLLWVEESDKDQQPQAARQSSRYVSDETTGSDALDRYGRWEALPDSEPVWFPTSVPDDWAPYRFGHWDWIEPWGWTWIDDQPWGFAPFHYGRWVNIDGRWGWVPGEVQPHPVYAPALVAFVDTPEGAGGGPDNGPDNGPDVGWFPLGPDDDYVPWYQAGPDYVASVNAPEHGRFHDFGRHGDDAHGREAWRGEYSNRRFATVVSREAFADARRLDRGMVRQVAADRLAHAAVMRGAPHVTPAVFRSAAGPGEFRGGLHGATPAAAEAGGVRARPGGVGAEHAPGMAARGGPGAAERGGERGPQGFGRPEGERGPAAAGRGGASQFGHSEAGRSAGPEAFRGGQQFGRPESSQGFRGAQQFGRPEVSQGFRGGQQFGRPEVSQGFRGGQQFGRPEVPQGFRGGQQFGRPQVAQGFRGGQFGRPQVFQTPAAGFRGGGMTGRAAPAAHFGGGGGGGGRHK